MIHDYTNYDHINLINATTQEFLVKKRYRTKSALQQWLKTKRTLTFVVKFIPEYNNLYTRTILTLV